MRVEATRTVFKDLRRYREGVQFNIESVADFSPASMKPAGKIPPEWESEIAAKIEQHEKRKTPEQIRREAVEAKAKADAKLQAETLAATVGPIVAQALALQREEHAKLIAAASGKPPGK